MRKIIAIVCVLCVTVYFSACKSANSTDKNSVTSKPVVSDNQSNVEQDATLEAPIVDSTPSDTESKLPSAVAPQTQTTGKKIVVSGALQDNQYTEKTAELQQILNSHKYNISLSVYAVDGSKGLDYNTETGIFGACTVKAAYTLYACKQMESGNGNLQTQMTYEQKHYEPGTGDMQYSPFGTVFLMETALHKSMSISDNVGYLMSVDYFGRDGYNTYMRELGCDSLQIKPTVWSLRTKADDLVKIWCEIYNYFGTDTEYARFLKNSCTNTAGNYATESLQGVEYSHKQGHNSTGDWLSFSDAGIVWKGDTPYIIAIITDAPGPNSYSRGEFAKIIDIVHNNLF